jgi:predicted DNA-binding transcriptional regulator YafY
LPTIVSLLMARGDSLARQLKLLLLLDERREVAIAEAARELGSSRRTVYRDLAVLQDVGVPLYQEQRGTRARWRVTDQYRRRIVLTLSWSEMLALTAGRHLLSGLAGTLFHESALTALEKVRGALPPALLKRVDAATRGLSGIAGERRLYDGKREFLATLIEAVERQETVELGYQNLSESVARTRRIDPYHVHVQAGAVYFIGWSHERQAPRVFVLDRVTKVSLTGQRFQRRADFLASQYLQGAFGPWDGKHVEVKLRFAPKLARLVSERVMHPTQASQLRSDGALDVTMRAPVSHALVAWVRGFGNNVEVLAPKGLLKTV